MTGRLRQCAEGLEFDLPDVGEVGTAAAESGVCLCIVDTSATLTAAEARQLAEYLLEAAAWVELVTADRPADPPVAS